ncbi:hypothetical protein [Proteiniclasticum sp. QWL-01]|uniref:hypothetical protein n=1 Tax=Proteiniclasticum sp. QWL-01 TaxID=3036945 RepID=UPI00240F3E45|nr:hypothetical protein [Proteiniclasticum sp. QWL-01]WFF72668.1 hypothetical protein P6M73_15570 [Proteiniclasticum sp. QWL-01]
MKTLTINGVAVAAPVTLEVNLGDLDAETSGRNVLGTMMRDRIAGGKRKISLKWGPLSDSEIAAILNAVSPVFFPVSYPDPISGQKTITAYVGDRSAALLNYSMGKWLGLSFNLIER